MVQRMRVASYKLPEFARAKSACAFLVGYMWALGKRRPTKTAEAYCPETNTWEATGTPTDSQREGSLCNITTEGANRNQEGKAALPREVHG